MRKFFVLGLMSVCVLMVSAQNQERGQRGLNEEDRAKRYEELKKNLKLTDVQVDSLKAIDAEFLAKMRGQRGRQQNQSDADREKRREEMRKMNEKRTERIKAVLTEEQYKKYTEDVQVRRQRGGEGRPGGGQGRSGGQNRGGGQQ
jgi:hypothetical protein